MSTYTQHILELIKKHVLETGSRDFSTADLLHSNWSLLSDDFINSLNFLKTRKKAISQKTDNHGFTYFHYNL